MVEVASAAAPVASRPLTAYATLPSLSMAGCVVPGELGSWDSAPDCTVRLSSWVLRMNPATPSSNAAASTTTAVELGSVTSSGAPGTGVLSPSRTSSPAAMYGTAG